MFTAAHLLFAIVSAILFTLGLRLFWRVPHWTLAVLSLSTLVLCYDNLIIGLGNVVGASALLRALSGPRYWGYAVTTPLLAIVGLYLARYVGSSWAVRPQVVLLFWAATLPMLALEVYSDIIALDLVPAASFESMHYINATLGGSPVAMVVAMFLLFWCGIGLLRQIHWPWLLLGDLMMWLATILGATSTVMLGLGKLGLIGSLVISAWVVFRTERRVPRTAGPYRRKRGEHAGIPLARILLSA